MQYDQDDPQAFDGAGPAHQAGPNPLQMLQQYAQQADQHRQQIEHLQQVVHGLQQQNAQPAQQAGNVPQPPVAADAGGGPAVPLVRPFASVKVDNVQIFTGEGRENARLWLARIRLYMDCLYQGAFAADNQRIQFVGTRLGGYAASWFMKYWYGEESVFNKAKPFSTQGEGPSFEKDFYAQFQPVGGDRTARVDLLELTCKHAGQYSSYHKKFLELQSETSDMSQADQVCQFIRGLPSDMSRWILMRNPETLSSAMQAAALYVQNEKTHRKTGNGQGGAAFRQGGRPRFGGQRPFGQRYGNTGSSMYSRPVSTGSTYDGPAPMELGQRLLPPGADRRYRVGPKERSPGESNSSQCFNCGKFGHWVQNCDKQLDDARIRTNAEKWRRSQGRGPVRQRGRGSVQFQCRNMPGPDDNKPSGSYASDKEDWSMGDGPDQYFSSEER